MPAPRGVVQFVEMLQEGLSLATPTRLGPVPTLLAVCRKRWGRCPRRKISNIHLTPLFLPEIGQFRVLVQSQLCYVVMILSIWQVEPTCSCRSEISKKERNFIYALIAYTAERV